MAGSPKRRSLHFSKETLDSRTLSTTSLDSVTAKQTFLKHEIDNIRDSLDSIKTNILSQQFEIAREFEDRVRQTYDGVINDLNQVRQKVNTLGDEVAANQKFKSWVPTAPFRKDVLKNNYEIRKPSKLTSSKSVDFVDSCVTKDSTEDNRDDRSSIVYGFEGQGRFSSGRLKMASTSDLNKCKLGRSKSNMSSRANSTYSLQHQKSLHGSTVSVPETRTQVPGFGCCFTGDNKTYPYRTYRAKYYSFYRYNRPGHSWGPSRSGSRSTLDDDDDWCDDESRDRGVMCGVMPDDWRIRVAPYMWEGWSVPGLDKHDVDKLRERLKKFDEIRDELVDVQNEYRARHNCPALTVTEQLSRDAQEWAELLAMKGYAQYSDSQSRGENILVIDIEEEISGRQVIDTWYREGQYFNYKRPGWQRGTSNFTQMIWRSTREVGVGIAKFPYTDTYVVVAQYKPQGNVNAPGQFRANVPVPKFNMDNVGRQLDQEEIVGTKKDTKVEGDKIERFVDELQPKYVPNDKQHNELQLVSQNSGGYTGGKGENSACFNTTREPQSSEINESGIFDVTNSFNEYDTISEHIHEDDINNKMVECSKPLNIFDRMKDNSFNDFETLSEHSHDDSTDDILLSVDDNPDEMFKEKLVGRHLLDKQVVDEMIRELVNERIEQETQPDFIDSDGELELNADVVDFTTISFDNGNKEQKDVCVVLTENDVANAGGIRETSTARDDPPDSSSELETVSRLGSVSDSMLSERSDTLASVSDSLASVRQSPAILLDGDADGLSDGNEATLGYRRSVRSVSDSLASEIDSPSILTDSCENETSDNNHVVPKHPVRSVSDSELGDTSDETGSVTSVDNEIGDDRTHMNRKFVVKIDTHSETITDV